MSINYETNLVWNPNCRQLTKGLITFYLNIKFHSFNCTNRYLSYNIQFNWTVYTKLVPHIVLHIAQHDFKSELQL